MSEQPELNIGLVGHIDHGKTTLLWRLTGVWADKHSEELKRGITIRLGYADVFIRKCKCGNVTTKQKCEKCGAETEKLRWISFVDAPGHEMLMATMLGGAAIIDAALLVIAANEPFPQPQTKEHLLALEAKGIDQLIVVQNKLDLVKKEEALEQYKKIKDWLKGTSFPNAEIIPVCAQQGINLNALLEAILRLRIPKRNLEAKPLFLVARSFDVNLPGARPEELVGGVLGGCLKQGKLKLGDEIEIKPGLAKKKHDQTVYKTLQTKIAGLRVGNVSLSSASPGGSLAIQTLLDPLLAKADSLAGCVVGLKGTLPEPKTKLKLKTHLFKEIVGTKEILQVEPIKMSEYLMLSINTATTVGTVTKTKPEIEIELKIPVVPFPGDRVGIARNYQGHWRLIGWGEII